MMAAVSSRRRIPSLRIGTSFDVASIAPMPRTSPISGQRSCHCSMRARIVFPTVTPRATRFSSSKMSSTAKRGGERNRISMSVPLRWRRDGRRP